MNNKPGLQKIVIFNKTVARQYELYYSHPGLFTRVFEESDHSIITKFKEESFRAELAKILVCRTHKGSDV